LFVDTNEVYPQSKDGFTIHIISYRFEEFRSRKEIQLGQFSASLENKNKDISSYRVQGPQ